jgi:hypothetical protein
VDYVRVEVEDRVRREAAEKADRALALHGAEGERCSGSGAGRDRGHFVRLDGDGQGAEVLREDEVEEAHRAGADQEHRRSGTDAEQLE